MPRGRKGVTRAALQPKRERAASIAAVATVRPPLLLILGPFEWTARSLGVMAWTLEMSGRRDDFFCFVNTGRAGVPRASDRRRREGNQLI